MAGGEGEDDYWDGGDEADPGDGEGVAGALVEIPDYGCFEDLISDDGDAPAAEEKAEATVSQGGVGIVTGWCGGENFFRRRGCRGRALIIRLLVSQLCRWVWVGHK